MKKRLFIHVFTALWGILCYQAAWADKGKDIYEKACKTCHMVETAAALKSPPVHDEKAWKARFESAKSIADAEPGQYKDAMAVLVASIRKGKGAMPPGGMCVDPETPDKRCTDADYIAAIKFMSSPK